MPFRNKKDAGSLEACREVIEKLESIKSNIASIARDMQLVGKLQQAILDDPLSDERKKRELLALQLQSNIKVTSNLVRKNLKDVDSRLKQQLNTSHTAAFRSQNSQYIVLSKRFIDLISDYNQAEIDYRDRCKQRLGRKLDIAGMHLDDDQMDEMLKSDPGVFTQRIIADSQIAKQTLADVKARREDIVKLESEILELNEIMSEMAFLVENQGDMVDRIDLNIGDAVISVDEGITSVQTAETNNRRYRRKKCWCVIGSIVALVVIIIIIIIWVYTSR